MKRITNKVMTESTNLLSKFKGALLGTLIGDCYGAPYEGDVLESVGDRQTLRRYLDKLEGPYFKAPAKPYTDDTALTMCVARCLIEDKGLIEENLAKSFCKKYFQDQNRGYGAAVDVVFRKLIHTKFADPFGPARDQFNGSGSYGNGAAMRIAPIALFCHNKPEQLVELTKNSAEITHANRLGIDGAILQAIAIHMCVTQDANEFCKDKYLDQLIEKIDSIEKEGDGLNFEKRSVTYTHQLGKIKKLLEAGAKVSDEQVVNILGHSVAALYSVPTSIFCFLRAQDSIEGINTQNPFRRTLEYAISLGGDTDTIASMASSLTGALHGDAIVPENFIKHCESHDEILCLANELYDVSQ